MNKTKGFTLVELLVVMAIISFLTVGSFAGLTYGLRQARDTQRRTIVTLINTALLAYYADFQEYPGQKNSSFMNPSCGGTKYSSNDFDYYYCSTAFSATGGLLFTHGKNGLADYFEGTFSWGPIDSTSPNSYIGYYEGIPNGAPISSAKPLKYGICVTLENPNGGNVANATNPSTRDCFCQGSDYAPYACRGLTRLAQ